MKYLPMTDKRFTGLKFVGGKVNVSFLYGSFRTLSGHLHFNLSPINISVVEFVKIDTLGLHVSGHEKLDSRKCS